MGFVPARDPALAIIVVVDEPHNGFHGGEIAAPVFARIALPIPPVPGRDARGGGRRAEPRRRDPGLASQLRVDAFPLARRDGAPSAQGRRAARPLPPPGPGRDPGPERRGAARGGGDARPLRAQPPGGHHHAVPDGPRAPHPGARGAGGKPESGAGRGSPAGKPLQPDSHRGAALNLSRILEQVEVDRMSGPPDPAVLGIAYDSRRVERGYLFAAVAGEKQDGNRFVPDALERGACAILSACPAPDPPPATWVRVFDDREALALSARNYYSRPDERIRVAGITGTNGKTTVVHLLESILAAAGEKVCALGTLAYRIGREEIRAERTTPESVDLYRLLDRAAAGRMPPRRDGGLLPLPGPQARGGPPLRRGRLHQSHPGPSGLPRRHGALPGGKVPALPRPRRRVPGGREPGRSGFVALPLRHPGPEGHVRVPFRRRRPDRVVPARLEGLRSVPPR